MFAHPQLGVPLDRSKLPKRFNATAKRAHIRDAVRFHDLRHTFATLQLAAGTNPKIVSEVLGHKEIAITLDRYSHALPTMQTEAMARVDALLGRGPGEPAAEAPRVASAAREVASN